MLLFFSFKYLLAPAMVPPVPTPATNAATGLAVAFALVRGNVVFSNYLQIPQVPGADVYRDVVASGVEYQVSWGPVSDHSAQFIVVTHQKRTMDAADTLYGVSMGGDGISRVVSRKLAGRPAERCRGFLVGDAAALHELARLGRLVRVDPPRLGRYVHSSQGRTLDRTPGRRAAGR